MNYFLTTLRLGKNILIVLFVILMIDGFLYRDPGVVLSDGYEISAISPSSPCLLHYQSWNDDRTYNTEFRAQCGTEVASGKKFYSLASESEYINFDTEEEWLTAIQEFHIAPDSSRLSLEDVNAFSANENYIIGTYGNGQFIVDIETNTLSTFDDESTWSEIVLKDTELSPDSLKDPRSPWLQSRHWIVNLLYLLLFATAIITTFIRIAPEQKGLDQVK